MGVLINPFAFGGGGPPPGTDLVLANTRWDNAHSTGDRRSDITVTTSFSPGGGAPASNLVSGSAGDAIWSNDATGAAWIKFHFPEEKCFGAVAIFQTADPTGMGQWKFQISDDDISYTDISAAVQFGRDGIGTQVVPIDVEATGSYLKFQQVSGAMGVLHDIKEFDFCLVGPSDSVSYNTPDYANVGGSGDRRAQIDIRGDIAFVGGTGRTPTETIDGTNDNETWFNSGQSGKYIQFNFGTPNLIEEIKYRQSGAASQGTWKWQGYDPIGASWVDIITGIALGAAAADTIIVTGAADTYASYRLQQTAGVTSSGPYVRQFEFKIGYPAP